MNMYTCILRSAHCDGAVMNILSTQILTLNTFFFTNNNLDFL